MGMTEDLERIEFSDHPDSGAVMAGVQHCFETGQGDAIFKRNAEVAKFLRGKPRGFPLPESRLRMFENRLGNLNQLRPITINLSLSCRFEFFYGGHRTSSTHMASLFQPIRA